jgi:hypothetical protein
MFAIPILICGLVLAAACGRAPGPSVPTASGSASASASAGSGDLTAFVNCVRQHGVTVPDPDPDFAWQQAEHSAGWEAAWEACRALLPPPPAGAASQLPSAQELEQLRVYAVCMRAHGIAMSDPDRTGDMQVGGRLENVTRAQLNNDPGYKAAQAACRDKLPARNPNSPSGGKKKNQ